MADLRIGHLAAAAIERNISGCVDQYIAAVVAVDLITAIADLGEIGRLRATCQRDVALGDDIDGRTSRAMIAQLRVTVGGGEA